MFSIAENLSRINERIASAAERSGRTEVDVLLIAVSKTRTPGEVCEAIRAGIQVLGENRIQEAERKIPEVPLPVVWHLVGHLQRNKARKAVELFDMIQSVDSLRIAQEISKRALAVGKCMDVLVEVNTSGEETKFGIAPEQALDFVGEISDLKGIEVSGLMTIGAFLPNPEDVRPCFVQLRKLKERIENADIAGVHMAHLSMGMSQDFEAAVEEGANMVRVGTGIFGVRR